MVLSQGQLQGQSLVIVGFTRFQAESLLLCIDVDIASNVRVSLLLRYCSMK